jgi:radical SAM protein with 4Fe4S-binding SPASM domain
MNRLLARKVWEVIRKPSVCAAPLYVQFEATTHCNLACYMCVRNEVIKHPRHLEFGEFQRVFDEIRAPKLTLSGAGEPLLHPELTRIIAHAKSAGASVMIPTNGTLLNRAELAEAIVASGLDVLKVSIDAATAGTYRAIRRQDCFDRIVEGLTVLEEVKNQQDRTRPQVRLDAVILEENYREIGALVRLAERLGIRTVFFRAVQTKGIGEEREQTIGKDVDFDALYEAVLEGIAEARRLRIRTNLADVKRDFRSYRSIYIRQDAAMAGHVCLLPWLQCFISVKGEVSPCCATYTNESFTAGNVFEKDFETVWNGPRMREIRRVFRQKQNPFAVCRDCIPRSVPVLLKMSSMLPGFMHGRR